jgi:hypothetical protein
MDDTQSIDELFSAHIAWIKEAGLPRWHATYRGEKCELTMNNFPEEPLYTLRWRGESIDFDDSPLGWFIPRN